MSIAPAGAYKDKEFFFTLNSISDVIFSEAEDYDAIDRSDDVKLKTYGKKSGYTKCIPD